MSTRPNPSETSRPRPFAKWHRYQTRTCLHFTLTLKQAPKKLRPSTPSRCGSHRCSQALRAVHQGGRRRGRPAAEIQRDHGKASCGADAKRCQLLRTESARAVERFVQLQVIASPDARQAARRIEESYPALIFACIGNLFQARKAGSSSSIRLTSAAARATLSAIRCISALAF